MKSRNLAGKYAWRTKIEVAPSKSLIFAYNRCIYPLVYTLYTPRTSYQELQPDLLKTAKRFSTSVHY